MLDHGAWDMVGIYSVVPLKKTDFSLSRSSISNSFLARGKDLCPFPIIRAGILPGLNLDRSLCIPFTVSWGSYVHQSCCAWKMLLLWSHPPLFALTVLAPPLLNRSLSIKRRGVIYISHLYKRIMKIHLHIGRQFSCSEK